MKLLKIGVLGVAWAVTAAVLGLLAYQVSRNARLSEAIAQTRAATGELAALRNQHADLVAAAPAQAESVQREQAEIVRRKIEIDSLRIQLATLRGPPQAAADRAAQIERTKAQAALIPVPPGMLTPDMLQNVGRATPVAAWQTWQWAMQTNDWKTKMELSEFEPAAHDALQAIFDTLTPDERTAFGTPERMGLAVLAADKGFTPSEFRMFPRLQVAAEARPGPGEAILSARFQWGDGSIHDAPPLRMKQFPDGWKTSIGPEAVPLIRAHLAALPPTQRLSLQK
jgi:hypothetical protein